MPTNQNEELNKYKKDKRLLQFKLMDGEEIQGRVNWFDNFNIGISAADKEDVKEMTILKHAIAYYYPL